MSRSYILKTKIFRPVLSREGYALQSIESAFPSGDWVEVEALQESPVAPGRQVAPGSREAQAGEDGVLEGSIPKPPILTVIGDTNELEDVGAFVESAQYESVIVGRLPSGRGAESKIAAHLEQLDIDVVYIDADKEQFGKDANDVNVEQVLTHDITSPVLLLGNGARVKQAKSWLERAKWPREVHTL